MTIDRPVRISAPCLTGTVLGHAPPEPPGDDVANDLDSDVAATRAAALELLDQYLARLESWAWAAETSCRIPTSEVPK